MLIKRVFYLIVISGFLFSCQKKEEYMVISVDDYKDKMKAAWIGQMAGVGWGEPTEFLYHGEIIPTDKVPAWNNNMINCFGQDDMYVEMTFMKSMEKYGVDCDIIHAGIDFANSEYMLWGANREGRSNMRKGIAPPASSHPRFNKGTDWIDYQIEADYSGIIAPGMPNVSVDLGETFGRLVNYGDGLYGGQFIGAMYAYAFFENDVSVIIDKALKHIPYESQYAECMRDVVQWHQEDPEDWQKTWKKIEEKYHDNPDYQKYLQVNPLYWSPMDAKLNGAFVLMGLLYGNGNPDNTIVISMRCGRDSDCNPSNAAGILFATKGMANIDSKYYEALDKDSKFSYTDYSFNALVDISLKFAKDFVIKSGGKIQKDGDGNEIMYIPVEQPRTSEFVQSWEPKPFTGDSLFTEEQSDKIIYHSYEVFDPLLKEWGIVVGDGFRLYFAAKESETQFISRKGNDKVLKTVTSSTGRSVELFSDHNINEDNSMLAFKVGTEKGESWHLKVMTEGKNVVVDEVIDDEATTNGWKQFNIDLSKYIGSRVRIQIFQSAVDGQKSTAYWADMQLKRN